MKLIHWLRDDVGRTACGIVVPKDPPFSDGFKVTLGFDNRPIVTCKRCRRWLVLVFGAKAVQPCS